LACNPVDSVVKVDLVVADVAAVAGGVWAATEKARARATIAIRMDFLMRGASLGNKTTPFEYTQRTGPGLRSDSAYTRMPGNARLDLT
jgi:hypothetical protein